MKRLLTNLWISTLGVSLLLMTACSGKSVQEGSLQTEMNKEIAMGRYVETNLDFPDVGEGYVIGICQTEAGVELYTYNDGIRLYHLGEGAIWEEKEVPWKEAFSQLEEGWIQGSIWKEEGDLYFAYCIGDEGKTDLYAVREGQNIERLNIQWTSEDGYITPEKIDILPSGDLVVADAYIGVERYSSVDGTFVRDYGGEAVSFATTEDTIYQIEFQDRNIKGYDLETGELLETIPCENVDEGSKLIAGKEGDLYLVNRQGINHLVKGGSIWERVVVAEMTSFGMPSLYCTDLIVEGESFFVLFEADGGYQFKQYVYSKDAPSKPITEVTLYMLEEDTLFKQAAAQYQVDHPEVQVSIQVGRGEDSTLTKSDAIRTLNTQLLAGKGPDLLILDDLPIEDYVEKGILEDMSEWTKPFIDQSIWLPEVAKGYKKEDKLYALPSRFTIPTLWGDQEVIHEAEDLYSLAQWVKEHPEEKVLSIQSAEQLIRQFYLSASPTWRDEKGFIKEAEFTQFLEAIKVVMESTIEEEGQIILSSTAENKYFGTNLDSLLDVAYHETAVHLMTPETVTHVIFGVAGNEERGQSDFTSLGAKGEEIFIPRGIVGINAQSNQKDIAREIIEIALSQEVQGSNVNDGFAVNQEALEASLQVRSDMSFSFADPEGKGRSLEILMDEKTKDAYSQELKKFLGLCQNVKVPVTVDELLIEIILEETKGYFNGESTAIEAAQAVSSRIRAYLIE